MTLIGLSYAKLETFRKLAWFKYDDDVLEFFPCSVVVFHMFMPLMHLCRNMEGLYKYMGLVDNMPRWGKLLFAIGQSEAVVKCTEAKDANSKNRKAASDYNPYNRSGYTKTRGKGNYRVSYSTFPFLLVSMTDFPATTV